MILLTLPDTDYTWMLVDDGETYISWPNAQSYCRNVYGSNLASYHSDGDVNSHETMVINHDWRNLTCWLGLYEAYPRSVGNDKNAWAWIDNTTYDYQYWADGTTFPQPNSVNQDWYVQ